MASRIENDLLGCLGTRFDRIDPAPFSIDLGTVEDLVVNANGGDDSFAAIGNLAALILTTVDGGAGNDTINGTNGPDVLLGGAGYDFVDGEQGNDLGLLGGDDDRFQWDPGDGSDTFEGQDGFDKMLFNGSGAGENFDVAAIGQRVRFFRDVAKITMDTDDVEEIDLNAVGGTDTVVVNDLSGTDLAEFRTDLALQPGSGSNDVAEDNVIVHGTNGNDVAVVGGQGSELQLVGLATNVSVTAAAVNDRLNVAALDGDDVIDASGVTAGSAALVLEGGVNDDVLIGGDGDDVLIGGPGFDTLDGGPGDDTLIGGEVVTDGLAAGADWLAAHSSLVDGKTVLDVGGKRYTVPVADLVSPTPGDPTS